MVIGTVILRKAFLGIKTVAILIKVSLSISGQQNPMPFLYSWQKWQSLGLLFFLKMLYDQRVHTAEIFSSI